MNALRTARAIVAAIARRPDVRASLALVLIGYGCRVLGQTAAAQRDEIEAGRAELAELMGKVAAARSMMRATEHFAQTMESAKQDAANRLRAAVANGFTDEEAGGNGIADPDPLGAIIRDELAGETNARDVATTLDTNGAELVDELAAGPETD